MIPADAFRDLYRCARADGIDTARDAAAWADIDPADALTLATDIDPECEDRYAAPDVDPEWWAGMAESWPAWDAFDPAAWEVPLLAALESVADDAYREHYRDEIDKMAAAILAGGADR